MSLFISKKFFALGLVLIIGLTALYFLSRQPPEGRTASNDIPIIIRTNGGLLEVGIVKHRRSFDLTKFPHIGPIELPFCKESASYVVDAAITYRVKLAKRWVGDYSGGVLSLIVPPPEPAIPVAFDTSKLRATLDDCALMPSLNAKDELLRSISGQLAQDARGPRYMKLARGEAVKATIKEFAQKWLLQQARYNLPKNTPIEVTFSDE